MSFEMKGKGFQRGSGFTMGGGFAKGGAEIDDPLADVEYAENDLAGNAAKELTALQQGMADRAKKERERFVQATDSEFWFAVCFKSRADKEAFLSSIRVHKHVLGDKYLDGYKLAKILGVDMT